MELGYGDRVSVDGGEGSGLARDTVAEEIARYGLLLSTEAPVIGAPLVPGTIRVVVSRMRADVPNCPDWSRDASLEIGSNTSSNHGCAVNANLAAMIANPADLVRGRTGRAAVDPLLSTKAIDSYRKAPATGAAGIKTEKAGAK